MASTLRRLTALAARRLYLVPKLATLVLLVLCSCNRAAYQFRPSAAYLATERPAPSVPVQLALSTVTDSLPPVAAPPAGPSRQPLRKPRPVKKTLGRRTILSWTRPLAVKSVTKRFASLPSSPVARQASATGISGTTIIGLSLIGAGLVGLLVGAAISTNLVGALFGVFLILLGSIAAVAGLVLLLIALLADE